MKKKLTTLLALVLTFALLMGACGGAASETAGNEATAGNAVAAEPEMKTWKLGMEDSGAWNATTGPLYGQIETACEALGIEVVYFPVETQSAEGFLACYNNMIAQGCDGVILGNSSMASGIIPQVAEMMTDAGVYWSLFWTKLEEETDDYEAAMSSPYFISTVYEDDVFSSSWCMDILGEKGAKNVAEIGFLPGNPTGDMRDTGVNSGLEKYGMTLLADERDQTLTMSADGGKTIMDRFISAYPEMDGLVIAGMSQYVLSGVVSAMEEHGKTEDISLACIDFHENQTEYLKNGILDGIVGGHVAGPFYNLILMANAMNGTPLTDEPQLIQDNFITLSSPEDADAWDTYGKSGKMYSAEEILDMMVVNNPDYNLEAFNKMVADYSMDDIIARAGK